MRYFRRFLESARIDVDIAHDAPMVRVAWPSVRNGFGRDDVLIESLPAKDYRVEESRITRAHAPIRRSLMER